MSIINGLGKNHIPKSREDLQREERERFEGIQRAFAQGHLSSAYSLLFFYIMDKKEEQSFIDYELNEKWDQLLWGIEDMADDDGTPEGVKYFVKDLLKANEEEYYSMLALLKDKMKQEMLDLNELMDKLNGISKELLSMKEATQAWLERNTELEWNEFRPESELRPVRLFGTLLEITYEGFMGMLNNYRTLSSDHYQLVQSIDVVEMLNFKLIDLDRYPF